MLKTILNIVSRPLCFAIPALAVIIATLIFLPVTTPLFSHAEGGGSSSGDPSISIIPTGDLIIPINNCTGIGDGSNNTTVCTGTMDTSISITTSVTGGYSLYTNTSTTDNALSALGPSTSIISSITNPHSSLSSFPNNTWGYSKDNGATYLPIPTSTATAEQRQIATTTSAGTSTHNIDFAAKTDLSNTAGRYENTIIFSAVTNPTIFYLNYDANGGTGAPAQATCTSFESTCSFIVSDIIPTKDNYNFLGWATSSSATVPEYAAGDTYTATTPTNNTLHAVWEAAARYMQDVADWEDELEIGESIQAVDQRDNKLYWVTRLKTSTDGSTSEIWMTQNLDYDISAATNIISKTSDGSSSAWTSSSIYPPQATSTTLSAQTSYIGTYSWDPGDYYVPDGGVATACASWPLSDCANGIAAANSLTSSSAKGDANLHYHMGNYYQWNAATAGSGGTMTGSDTEYSICPAGWRLATSTSYTDNYSFGKLTNAYGVTNNAAGSSDTILRADPLYFVRSGYVYNGSSGYLGYYGYDWSSMSYSNGYAYYFGFYSSYVNPAALNARQYGLSVRCVAHPRYMQDVADWGSDLTVGESIRAVDRRDGKKYWVTKLADGNIWMTQNLDFNINATTATYLNSAYTDVVSWSPVATYYTKTTTSNSSSGTDYYSWDLGYYYYNPSGNTGWTSCGTSAKSYADCTGYGFSTSRPVTDAKGKNLSSKEAEHYQVGTLYQWQAATAGTGSSATADGDMAPNSICPAGWRLPYSGDNSTSKGFGYLFNQPDYNLINVYNNLTMSANPLYFLPGGGIAGTLNTAGNRGGYWSSQASGSVSSYSLGFDSSSIIPSYSDNRYYGYSVRCVARDDLLYMQDVDEWGDDLTEGRLIPVVDRRDGKTYWVSKLADGKIWMSQNLDLDLSDSVTLTPDDSDVSANWTPERSTITKGQLSATTWGTDMYNPYSYDSGDVINGNYYNWTAAIASNDSSEILSGTAAPDSICPKGWHLPDSDTSELSAMLYAQNVITSFVTAYQALAIYAANGFNKMTTAPVGFVQAGYVHGGVMTDVGSFVDYWYNNGYYLAAEYAYIYPKYGAASSRSFGFPVHCVSG